MAQKALGPNLFNEMVGAGIANIAVSWNAAGNYTFGPGITDAQKTAFEAVVAAHDPTKPEPHAAFAGAVNAGCIIQSAGTPALDGVYPIDDASRAGFTAEAIYLQTTATAGATKFTNGQATKVFRDLAGGTHTFTCGQAVPFLEALAQYYDALLEALDTALSGGAWVAPAAPAPIA